MVCSEHAQFVTIFVLRLIDNMGSYIYFGVNIFEKED